MFETLESEILKKFSNFFKHTNNDTSSTIYQSVRCLAVYALTQYSGGGRKKNQKKKLQLQILNYIRQKFKQRSVCDKLPNCITNTPSLEKETFEIKCKIRLSVGAVWSGHGSDKTAKNV